MRSFRVSDDAAPDILTLRQGLLEYVQSLSGNIWTDYNIHDPGVMLLEQIAYSITETEYRSALPIVDRLASATCAGDGGTYHLTPPEELFCMQPVTVEDYEAVLSSVNSSVERVMIAPRSGVQSGLYDIYVIPASRDVSEQACSAVANAYSKIRNLCEDAEVLAAKPVRCTLALTLEHHRRASPERIVAEAFSICRDLLIGRPLAGDLISVDEAFSNPVRLTSTGWTAFGDHARNISSLTSSVLKIPDVLQVSDLQLIDCETGDVMPIADISAGEYLFLQLPDDLTSINLFSRGRQSVLDLNQVDQFLNQIKRDHKPHQAASFPILESASVIESERLNIAQELPVAYLAGNHIDPETLPERRRAPAMQFRSYLNLIDTLLDELESNRESMPDLFSDSLVRVGSDNAALSGGEWNGTDVAVAPAQDPDIERKSRVLDRLLGMFGEQFTQASLKRFRDSAENNQDIQILNNKRRLLRALPEVHPCRCAVSGFCKKLNILLEIPDDSTADGLPGFIVLEDILLRGDAGFRAMELDLVFPSDTSCDQKPGYRTFVEETVSLVCPAHILPRIRWFPASAFSALSDLVDSWKQNGRNDDAVKIRNTLFSDAL